MRRLTIFLVLSSFAAIGGTASAAAPPHAPSRPHTYRTVIHLSGDEYEDAQNNLLNNPRGTKCSAPPDVPVRMGCWTWTAKHLGHGTYTLSQPSLDGAHLSLDLHLHGLPRRQSHRQPRRGIHTGPITI